MASISLILIALTFAAVVAMMIQATVRRCKFARESSVMLLVGSVCAYLVVAILVAEFEASGFSPVVILTSLGALLAFAAAKWGLNFLVQDENTATEATQGSSDPFERPLRA